MPPALLLDHIIILVPTPTYLHAPPPALTASLALTPGGRHADGLTENALIGLADGSYLELIAFTTADASVRAAHWWGTKAAGGIIDFALTGPGAGGAGGEEDEGDEEAVGPRRQYEAMRARVAAGPVAFEDLRPGARVRPDGRGVRWLVGFPRARGLPRGAVPFVCYDRTPRAARVPEARADAYGCGAVGVVEVSVVVPEERVGELVGVYGAIFGGGSEVGGAGEGGRFRMGRVEEVEGVPDPVVVLRAPRDEEEKKLMDQGGGVLVTGLVLGRFGGSEGSEKIGGGELGDITVRQFAKS
ncbi:glyoxalase-like domain-containing protein [Lineolata rhizophorae]|uniref:Glyoxalase-like domain-containing protein n=1 Tax=Lineolata rhizophorae TaxID=578093 RepID=A0A6A6NWS7_9PEZI|nr:glyoxalase-like domain-containing protein [Lineolata rhizophorae]